MRDRVYAAPHRSFESRKVKKLKRLIGRSVVQDQHSGAGGVPVHFLGRSPPQRIAQTGRYGWARVLAYVTGTVDQELLARNEYLATENRILKDQLKSRLMLSDAERATLGEIGHAWVARFSPRWPYAQVCEVSCLGDTELILKPKLTH
jgi:hypothetical protein